MLEELREAVRRTALEMMEAGLVVGTDGNVSAKDPESGLIAITPTSVPYPEITTDDIVIVNTEQQVVWGKRRPSWETPMHTYIHAHRDDVFAAMHTHAWHATLFALANREIPPVTMSLAAQFGGAIPCAPYVRTGSKEMGEVNLRYLAQNGHAILLGNHGTLVVGESLERVLMLSRELEHGARMAYQAATLGPLVPLPAEEVRWLHNLATEATKKAGGDAVPAFRSHP